VCVCVIHGAPAIATAPARTDFILLVRLSLCPFDWDLTFTVVERCLPIGGHRPVMYCKALLSGNLYWAALKRVHVICSRKERSLAVWIK
jgi:hypothetical protein